MTLLWNRQFLLPVSVRKYLPLSDSRRGPRDASVNRPSDDADTEPKS